MPKDKKNDENPNLGGDPIECPETAQVFADYLEGADTTLVVAIANSNAKLTTFNGKQAEVCDGRRNYKKATETLNIYNSIYYCQVASLCKDIEQSQETVKQQTEGAAAVKGNFDKVIANLKTIKSKLTEVKSLAGVLETEVCNSCNSESKKSIGKKVEGGEEELLNCLAEIKELALTAEGVGDQAVESAVVVTGILAFTNVASIKSYTDLLKKKCDELKGDVEGNITSIGKTIEKAQKSLYDALCKLSESEAAWRMSKTVVAGVDQTIAHVKTRNVLPTTPFKEIPDAVKNVLTGQSKT